MTASGGLQASVLIIMLLATARPLGTYMYRVLETQTPPLPGWLRRCEHACYRVCGIDAQREQTWSEYAAALLLFSVCGMLVTYALQRLQGALPLNPQNLAGVDAALAFNTAASFVTNTNWQAYSGETMLSYLTQMMGLTWHNFTSAAAGLGVALALARGLTRKPRAQPTLGNFWVDVTRAILYVLLPMACVATLLLVSQGVIQNFAAYQHVTTLEGLTQIIAMGPVASQEAIKQLGTNGGGFFNANSAHPFENPTPLSNLLEMFFILVIPVGLTYTYGRMAQNTRQGWAILLAMAWLFSAGVGVSYWAEAHGNAALAPLALDQSAGNMEGKEVRFGVAGSALFATVTTAASCGAVNAMHDSFTPLGALVPLLNIQLGEVIFGGVGAGLYGVLIFVLLAVFIAGLMVGRTPEYLGKKIEGREIQLAILYILIFPLVILGLSAWAAVAPYALSSLNNAGPHGLTEILYAYTSAAGNNGSAFAGLNANTPWWNGSTAWAMLVGRFFMIVPVLAIAGAMVRKKTTPAGPGTFPTDGVLFSALLVAVIVIIGALTFFPALSLGPIVEHFVALHGKVY